MDRAKAAVLGALVADAATMGLHWIYDVNKIKDLLETGGKTETPEFFEPPSCPFYKRDSGLESPYGAEAFALLKFTAESGAVDGPGLLEYFYNFFKAYTGYVNHTMKNLIANWDAGKKFPETGDATDYQANCFVKVPVVVARYAGSPELEKKLEEAVRVQQNNDPAVIAAIGAGRILEKVILGATISEALEWAEKEGSVAPEVQAMVKAAMAAKSQPYGDAVKAFGLSCAMPGSMEGALNGASRPGSYVDLVRANIVAGGDNCSRTVLLGALLAAQEGVASIPAEWKSKTTNYAEIEALTDKLVAAARS